MGSASGRVWIDEGLYGVSSEWSGLPTLEPLLTTNGLVDTRPGATVIYTGINCGNVNLKVEKLDVPPELLDDNKEWEEIVEVSVQSGSNPLRVRALEADVPTEFGDLTAPGSSWYRLRVHALGRDLLYDLVAIEPVEDYLIQIWPAREALEQIHRQTDQCGKRLRLSAESRRNDA